MTRTGPIRQPGTPPSATRLNLRRVMLAWVFGATWITLVSGAPMVRFCEELGFGGHEFFWGALAAVPFVGAVFQFLGSYWVERYRDRKTVFFAGFLVQRVTWLAVGALPWLVLPGSPAAMMGIFGLVLMQASSGAVGVPAWTSWMADVIPPRLRGRYFGLRGQVGRLVIIPVALLAGWLLRGSRTGMLWAPYPRGWLDWGWWGQPFGVSTLSLCSMMFIVAAVFGILDILWFWRVPDDARAQAEGHGLVRPPALVKLLAQPLDDAGFRRFLLFFFAFTLSAPGIGNYVWRYLLNDLGVPEIWAQAVFMVAPAIGGILTGTLWGRLIDRFGRKTILRIACATLLLLPACWIAVRPGWWPAAFLIPLVGGIGWNGIEQANFNTLLHFASGEEGSSSYQAVFALAVALAGTLSGLLFGALAHLAAGWRIDLGGATFTHTHLLFAVATVVRAAAYFALLPGVHDDGREPARQAIRYAFTSVYNTVFSALSLPLRVFGVSPRNGADDTGERDESSE